MDAPMMTPPESIRRLLASSRTPLGDPRHQRNQPGPDDKKRNMKQRQTEHRDGSVKQGQQRKIEQQYADEKNTDQTLPGKTLAHHVPQ